MLEIIAYSAATISAFYFAKRRSYRYLSALQQDEYAPDRFFEWYKNRLAFDKRGSLIAGSTAFVSALLANSGSYLFILNCAAALILYLAALLEFDPRHEGKIKLVFTERAKKINYLLTTFYFSALALNLFSCVSKNCSLSFWLIIIAVFQLLPFLLIAAVQALAPFEKAVQEKYVAQAKQKVLESGALVVGITGSFGKTSTKNALGEILQVTRGSTFWPKKGINTLMGNTREIRQSLTSAYRYAIIEMGAYRIGSIANLCEIAPPKAAIITAIRSMHLERFGGEDRIYSAKTELARAVPDDGILVCNGDDLGARRAAKEFRKQTTLLYGFNDTAQDLDCHIHAIELSENGSKFSLRWKGEEYSGQTALIGKPALSNVMAVFCLACSLGADPNYVLAAISNLSPVDNRLSLQKYGNVIHLKDAYNSNPVGFEAALDVLKSIPGKRKILMTPGMIELGDKQYAENEAIAKKAAEVCDLILFVGETNKAAFTSGVESMNFAAENFQYFSHRDQALPELLRQQQDGDVVLIENDLPDWYEDKSGF